MCDPVWALLWSEGCLAILQVELYKKRQADTEHVRYFEGTLPHSKRYTWHQYPRASWAGAREEAVAYLRGCPGLLEGQLHIPRFDTGMPRATPRSY